MQKEKVVQKKNDSQKEEEDLKRRRGSGKEGEDLGYWKYTGSGGRPWRSEPTVWVRDTVVRRTAYSCSWSGVRKGLRDRGVQKQFSHDNIFILTGNASNT